MRRFIYIFIGLLIYLVFSSRSCVPDTEKISEEVLVEQAMDSLKSEFASDDLPGRSLRAFEAKATEKLADFAMMAQNWLACNSITAACN